MLCLPVWWDEITQAWRARLKVQALYRRVADYLTAIDHYSQLSTTIYNEGLHAYGGVYSCD
jgi:hypothetical protein